MKNVFKSKNISKNLNVIESTIKMREIDIYQICIKIISFSLVWYCLVAVVLLQPFDFV